VYIVVAVGREYFFEKTMGGIGTHLLRTEFKPSGDPVDVGVDWKGGFIEREEQDDGSGLWPHAFETQ
jgi:hypothetical protein